MNGVSLNGINNNIFQNPLTQNPITGNKGIFPGQAEDAKQGIIPRGTISGVEKAAEGQKSGFTIQMNVDQDTLELSGQTQEEGGLAIGTSLADMTDKERKDIAVQYFKEYTDLGSRKNSGELSAEEWCAELKVINDRYGVDWAGSYVKGGEPDEELAEELRKQGRSVAHYSFVHAEEVESTVKFRRDKSIEGLDPAEQMAKMYVDVTGTVDIREKSIQADLELQRRKEEEAQPSDKGQPDEASDENANLTAEMIADSKETRFSSQLIKTLLEDYAFQGEKTAVERLKERIEEERAQQKESRQERFEAFV